MSPKLPDKVLVVCPKCGHQQKEFAEAYTTFCRKCKLYFRVQYVLRQSTKPQELLHALRHVTCFQCGTDLAVPVTALSTMCKQCSSHVDLSDYKVDSSTSKNFKTKGRLVIEQNGFLFNTDSLVGEAIVKGRFIGKLTTEGALEIHPTAEIKGSFKAGKLVIPVGMRFRWKDDLKVGGAEISGEVVANLRAEKTVALKSTARVFGDITACNLVVENGAVIVGAVMVGI